MSSYLQKLQQVLVDTLSALDDLSGATFLIERPDTLSGKIEINIAQKTGLVVLVRFPYPTAANVASTPIRFDTVDFKIRVIDNILTNSTGQTAQSAAELIYQTLFCLDLTDSYSWILDLIQPRAEYPWNTQAGSTVKNIVEMTFETTLVMRDSS